jgi:hypothetical protein
MSEFQNVTEQVCISNLHTTGPVPELIVVVEEVELRTSLGSSCCWALSHMAIKRNSRSDNCAKNTVYYKRSN